ncbi:hypothetical protein [Avibacterium paragallinarum]|uniref:Uncharacterized protein n=1 Tax=Avibacterium paragallinarum TaxID=728 RepID=A0A377IAT6_AVIPA|nr:hypothetical protein [Avibacterium paragallinarum]POY47627.1 hypothetical protein C3364_00965 [Avibacterium paragallinarum]RZN75736.1 hypothetical protein EC523_07150 [Avibacterium paragallinarum]RZN76548.1 hypothetical protein EC523_04560 [Avibacterium paragallinarum]STO71892.1 Uncharacterised protein [Avibacterium paragallinarum]STO72612.1 Uncharacterised protein [Avibacterium paragallinarum]
MKEYEYILLDCDEDASKEDVLKSLEGKTWERFESDYSCLDTIAEEILKENHLEWEIYDEEADGVCLAVKKANSEDFEVYYVQPRYSFTPRSNLMFDTDDFKDESVT